MTSRTFHRLVGCTLVWLLAACAGGRQMIFASYEPGSQVAVVPLDNPEAVVAPGPNPLSITSGKLSNKAVRISAAGKASQFWFPPDTGASRIDIKVRSLPSCATGDGNRNRPMRLLLKAYQALTAKDFNLVRELCAKASQIDPTLAAPFIIQGLANLQEGQRERARVAFNKARALDPEDSEISELLRFVQ